LIPGSDVAIGFQEEDGVVFDTFDQQTEDLIGLAKTALDLQFSLDVWQK
jgi:hypothetical protein